MRITLRDAKVWAQAARGDNPLRVLLVDDEIDIIVPIKRVLEMYGFEVDAFDDPIDALQEASRGYAVAVFDIRMPSMNGFELYRKFREMDPKAGIFFMTAFDITPGEFKTMFPTSDVAGLLRKPVMIADIVEAIGRHLGVKMEKGHCKPQRRVPSHPLREAK